MSRIRSTPPTIGGLPHLGDKILRAVVDCHLGSQFAQGRVLELPCRGQHPNTERPRVLDRERPDPAAAPVHQQRLPRLYARHPN